MYKYMFVELAEKSNDFPGLFKIDENECNIYSVMLKKKQRAIKAFLKTYSDDTVIVSGKYKDNKLLSSKLTSFNEISFECFLAILNKVIRAIAEKYGYRLPLKEICVVAESQIANSIISCVCDTAQLFTVVNCETDPAGCFDELYFKYGVVVRKKEKFLLGREMIVISTDGTPVIEMENDTVSLSDVCVSDEMSDKIKNLFGINAGISLYTLMKILPGENAKIEIDRRPDEFFLLDRKKF